MNFVLKHFCEEASAAEAAFVRGWVGVILLFPVFWKSRAIYVSRSGLKIWVRSIVGAASVVCLFLNLKQTSVGNATTLANLSPVFVILLQYVFLQERIRLNEVFGTVIVVVGLVTLSSPKVEDLESLVILTGMFGALFAAIAYLTLKRAARDFAPSQIVWAFCLMITIAGLVLGGGRDFSDDLAAPSRGLRSGWGLMGLVSAGVLGLAAQLLMTRAFMKLPALVAASLTLSMVVWGVLFESLYIHTLPKLAAIISYLAVIGGLILIQVRRVGRGIPGRV